MEKNYYDAITGEKLEMVRNWQKNFCFGQEFAKFKDENNEIVSLSRNEVIAI